MPKLIYTAAKGLYEDNSSSEGFSVSDVAVSQKAYSLILGAPVYTFTILDEMNHATSGTNNEEYHDIDLTVYNAEGTAVTVTIDNEDGDFNGSGQHPTTNTDNLCVITGTANAETVARKIGQAFATADTTLMYSISTGSDTYIVKIWSVGLNRITNQQAALVEATAGAAGSGVIAQANNGGNSKAAFAAGDIVAAVVTQGQSVQHKALLADNSWKRSLVFTSVDESENGSALDTDHTDPTLADGGRATAAEWGYLGAKINLAAGDAEGQSITLINSCSYRAVNVTATNMMGNSSNDNALLHAGSVIKLVWNGSFWAEDTHGKSGTVTLS